MSVIKAPEKFAAALLGTCYYNGIIMLPVSLAIIL